MVTKPATKRVALQQWAQDNEPEGARNLIFAPNYWRQITFVRDTLWHLLFDDYRASMDSGVEVVGSHTSKSVLLPVFSLRPSDKLEIRMRNNFYNWAVSVKSAQPVPDNFGNLFEKDDDDDLIPVYFEGFEPGWVFGSFNQDSQQFSLFLHDDHQLYTFLYLLSESFGLGLRNNPI